MALPPGARLGPYVVVAPLGAGGMGEVYRARDQRLSRDVAIKILPPAFASDPDRLRRFEQEARAAAALNHPNVLAVFDVHIDRDVPYVVAELLEGGTLREVLARGALPARKAVDIAVQIAHGLAAAHDKGIVHRDLKPANVFVTDGGRAKILDFGLAKIVEQQRADTATAAPASPATAVGAVMGSSGYMAPEQVRGEALDHRADIFALGVVCYEMLTGRRTFGGSSQVDVMSAILRDDPPQLPSDVVSPALDRIVRRCLEKAPAQRFQSASDVAFALDALSGTSVSGAAPTPVPNARPSWLLAAVGVTLAVVGAASGVLLWRTPRSQTTPVVYEAKTFDRLPVMNARFMPDGQTVVYSAASRGFAPALYVISPSAEAPERLELRDAHLLSVSRTGELALVVNARYMQGRLYSGTLARMTLGSSPRAMLENVREADWGPDGQALAIVHDLGNGRDRLEYPAGTALHEIAGYLSEPRVSPDGTRVAFVEHPWRFDDRGRVMVVERGGQPRAVTPELWSIQGLAWTADGATLVFSGNDTGGGLMQPLSVSIAGSTAYRPVLSVPARLIVHDIARDGRWLAVREDLTFGVRAQVPGADSERELSWLGSTGARALSADGRQLLMVDVGLRSGPAYGVVLRATDGSQAVRLGTGNAESLSPDGRWAAAITASPSEVVLYPTGSGTVQRALRGRLDPVTSVQWFPDGNALLVCGTEAGTIPRCYRTGLDGSVLTPVTDAGVRATLAPDGRTLLLWMSDGSVHVGSLQGATPRLLPSLGAADRVVGWSGDSTAVYVQRGFEVPARVERVDVATGTRTLAKTIVPQGVGEPASVRVAAWVDDGRWYAYNYTTTPSVLFLVTGATP